MNTAILLIGHGSRDNDAVQEFYQLAEGFRQRFPNQLVATGFLELATPSIDDAIENLVAQGVTNISALPGILMAGNHAKSDIPKILEAQRLKHAIDINYGKELGVGQHMLAAARNRIEEAENKHQNNSRADTLLMVVGRGSDDPEVIANFNYIASTLKQAMGFADCVTAYSGISSPSPTACLENAKALGYERVMLLPYFLFTGRLVKRLHQQVDSFVAHNPDISIIKAGYLGSHHRVIDTFVQQLENIPTNNTGMS